MCVSEAIGVVSARADLHFGCLAHQVVVVDAFGALAGPDVGQDLGQAAVGAGVDEGRAGGMIFSSADGDCRGVAG